MFVTVDPLEYPYTEMVVSKENSSPSFAISEDKKTVSNPKGYAVARGSFGISEGSLYFEVEILSRGPCPYEAQTEPHIRLGVAMSQAEAEAPVGYDYFGFCYRDFDGSTFSQSRRKSYGKPFHEGDTVGVLLQLPPLPPPSQPTETNQNGCEEELVKVKRIPGSMATGRKPPTPLPVHPESKLSFFVNGEPQGIAYSNFHCGTYYPAVSAYMGGRVHFNFGPDFKYSLPPGVTARSAYEVGVEMGKAVAARIAREKAEAEQRSAAEGHVQHEKRHRKGTGGSEVSSTPTRTPSPSSSHGTQPTVNAHATATNNGSNSHSQPEPSPPPQPPQQQQQQQQQQEQEEEEGTLKVAFSRIID